MTKIIYVKNGTWWEHKGTLASAKKLRGTYKHREFDGEFGAQCILAQERPANFFELNAEEQWNIDKRLGILDWNGEPTK